MMNIFKERPSKFLGIEDTYTAYCLDTACMYIMNKMEKGETPVFKTNPKSFSELYKKYL